MITDRVLIVQGLLIGVGLLAVGYLIGRRPEMPDLTRIVCGRLPAISVECKHGMGVEAETSSCLISQGYGSCTDVRGQLRCTASLAEWKNWGDR
jgi:hypothetical protein